MLDGFEQMFEKPINNPPRFIPHYIDCLSNKDLHLLHNILDCIVFVYLGNLNMFWFYNCLYLKNELHGYKWENKKWKYKVLKLDDVIAYY